MHDVRWGPRTSVALPIVVSDTDHREASISILCEVYGAKSGIVTDLSPKTFVLRCQNRYIKAPYFYLPNLITDAI
jgi:hypothetical protein